MHMELSIPTLNTGTRILSSECSDLAVVKLRTYHYNKLSRDRLNVSFNRK